MVEMKLTNNLNGSEFLTPQHHSMYTVKQVHHMLLPMHWD